MDRPPDPMRSQPPDATREDVDVLVEQLLERGESSREVLDELCARHPEHAEVLRRRVRVLQDAGLLDATATVEPFVPEILGDFRLIERLGAGGMGVVYRATQRSLNREVALKLVQPDLLFFQGGRERFRREVETVAAMSHPG